MTSLSRALRRLHADRRAALSTEYLLIMALVALPLGLMLPLFLWMIRVYSYRIADILALPFA